jgi:hypothetical protein
MSLPHPSQPGKPSRLVPILVVVVLVLVVGGWSAGWLWARGQLQARLDEGAAGLRKAGYELGWRGRTIGGYPFRLDVTLIEPVIRDRSGWALEAPRLEGEAQVLAPTHWVVAAPQGLRFVRPHGGPVEVSGTTLRASLSHLANTPPNFSFEGADLTFRPAPGAQPFALSQARRVEFHLRQAPAEVGDEAGVWLSVDGGQARLTGLLGRIADGKPVSVEWDSRLSKASAFHGGSWADAVRNWVDAGGRMSVRHAGLTAGEALIGADGGTLSVGTDGRLRGSLDVSLRQAPRALAAMGATGAVPEDRAEAATAVVEARAGNAEAARAELAFQAGQTTLGPVALAPAPKVYEPR